MAKERPLSIAVVLGTKGKGLQEAIKDTKRLASQLTGLADTAAKAAVGFAAFKGGQLVANFARDSIEAGRDLQTNLNGLQSVFGSLTPQMVEFTKTTNGIGLSMAEAAKASTFIGSVLKQSGFAMDEVAEQTQRLTRLAADLSLTFGYDVQESLLAMTALFRGEYDPIEKFGVAMKQSEIDSEKAARGLDGLKGAGERLVDQQIRLELLYQRAGDSMGAYERQAGNLRVTQDTLRASFATMQQILGAAMLPAVADLTASLIPLIETIGPILGAAMQQIVPLLVAFSQNTEGISRTLVDFIKSVAVLTVFMANLAKVIVDNIDFIRGLAVVLGVLATGLYALRIGVAVFGALQAAALAFGITVNGATWAIRGLKVAIFAIPVVGWALGLASVGVELFNITKKAEDVGDSVNDMLDVDSLMASIDASKALNEGLAGTADAFDEVAAAGGGATDAVVEFYSNLSKEIAKQQAKLRLQQMGASEGLISAILGSGADWQRVFNDVVSRGVAGVADVQRMFRGTAAGFDEAMAQWEKEYGEPFRKFKEDALAARDALVEFTKGIQILPSVAETLGEFERNAVDSLASIEEKLEDAFDNEYLFRDSYENLLQYARNEFNVLRQIERQRDEIISRRNAAEALINSVQSSIRGSGRLVSLFGEVEKQVAGVDVVAFATRTVSASRQLKEFRTALITNFVEPIEKAASKADKLVSSYRAVVERTREFVENLKTLRSLGLDPMLFNQLVEAGVEAGGATAQALVEGGSETINELNGLFKELDTLGAELGENTAQVMFGQGQNFVNGIVEGLEDQAGELELSAKSIAEAFTKTFEQVLVDGINAAIDAAEAAIMARMPRLEDFMRNMNFGGRGGGGGGGGDVTGATGGASVRPPLSNTLLNAGLSAASTTFGATGFSGLSALQNATPNRISTPYSPLTPGPSGLLGPGRGAVYQTNYNITTSALTPRTLQNGLTATANRSGVVSTSRPGALDRRVG
jgi:hypothetical protein